MSLFAAVGSLWQGFNTTATQAASSISNTVNTLSRNINATATAAATTITQTVSNTVRNVNSTAAAVAGTITKTAGTVRNAGTQAVQSISSGAASVAENAVKTVSSLPKMVVSTAGATAATATAAATTIGGRAAQQIASFAAPVSVPITAGVESIKTGIASASESVGKTLETIGKNPPVITAENPISGTVDTVINARDDAYASGDLAVAGAAVAGDILLPLDLVNVVNKAATGRGGELTTEDYLGAAIDAAAIALGVVSGGLGYGLVKTAKTGFKGATKMSKISALSKLLGRRPAPKKIVVKKAAPKPAPKAVRTTAPAKTITTKTPVKTATPKVMKTTAPAKTVTTKTPVKTASPKTPVKQPATPKVSTANPAAPSRGIIGTLADVGSLGLTGLFAWSMFGGGTPEDEYIYEETEPLPGEDGALIPETTPYESDDPWIETPDGQYYDSPILPEELQPLEEIAEGLGGYLEDVPVVGDVAEAARRRGLSLPFLLALGAVAVIGGRWVWKMYKAPKKAPKTTKAASTTGTAKTSGKKSTKSGGKTKRGTAA